MTKDATTAPPDLDAASKRLWKRIIAALKAQQTWEDSDDDALEPYVRAVKPSRKAREERGPC